MATSKKKNKKEKSKNDKHINIKFDYTVLQFIRQHSRSSPKVEICGVLIGWKDDKQTIVEAAIAGKGASQGGAHVTFTQETWNHIHHEKEEKYPEKSIIGWYHSHPGFGVFLSEHDVFIHNNFFSDPAHIAWVFDPVSDEEGCFGWIDGEVCRIRQFEITTDVDDVENKKSLKFDIPSQLSKCSLVLKRFSSKKWLMPFLACLNILFFVIILILIFTLLAKDPEMSNSNNTNKNEVGNIKYNTPSSLNNGESLIQEEKSDTLEDNKHK